MAYLHGSPLALSEVLQQGIAINAPKRFTWANPDVSWVSDLGGYMVDAPGEVEANANPSKAFFIAMLTRDIDLDDCVLDLLDNSVDGIGHQARRQGIELPEPHPFAGRKVEISFNQDFFEITDASGGIPLQVATEYAFRFGRPDDAPPLEDGSIGLYGIGMKRALFKMGNLVKLVTSTGEESFSLDLNVKEWRDDAQAVPGEDGNEAVAWSFDLTDVVTEGTTVPVGTTIRITELYPTIQRQFEDKHFADQLVKTIARDYAFIMNRGLEVEINGVPVSPAMPTFRVSAEISPFKHLEELDGVRIEIQVGLADPPPNDVSAKSRNPKIDAYGWYVVCNDRVVVSADKTSDTVWGVKPVPTWHPQFAGFMGIARFQSDDPSKLPWKTTKRDVEASNRFFRHALPVMLKATKRITDYTNTRRAEARRLVRVERAAPQVAVARVVASEPAKLPLVNKNDLVSIEYVREADDVKAVAEALGLVDASPSEVGIQTFEYYYKREVSR